MVTGRAKAAVKAGVGTSINPGHGLLEELLARFGVFARIANFRKKQHIFSQNDSADAVFYIQNGSVKLNISSQGGKEATIGLLHPGDFLGEESIGAEHAVRTHTAIALTDCILLQIKKEEVIKMLREQPAFSELFIQFLLARNLRTREQLVDQLFNSTEKRLARALLMLAGYNENQKGPLVVPKISQEALAAMVGTTRSRINMFMNRFKKLGYVRHNGELIINSSLLDIAFRD